MIALPHDRMIVHIIPRQYIVDGNDSILDPVGMVGSRLEVETHIVTITNSAIQNLLKCCERAGFHPQELVLNAYASGEAVLVPAERSVVWWISAVGPPILPLLRKVHCGIQLCCLWGDYITSDLAVGCELLTGRGHQKGVWGVLPELTSDNLNWEVPSVGGRIIQSFQNSCQYYWPCRKFSGDQNKLDSPVTPVCSRRYCT